MKKKLVAIPLVTALAITPLTSVFGESNEVNASSSSQISSYSESYVTENNEKYTNEYDSELGHDTRNTANLTISTQDGEL